MRGLVRVAGLVLMSGAAVGYFVGAMAGLCTALFVLGSGLFVDSMTK